jgi:hypothetical protein
MPTITVYHPIENKLVSINVGQIYSKPVLETGYTALALLEGIASIEDLRGVDNFLGPRLAELISKMLEDSRAEMLQALSEAKIVPEMKLICEILSLQSEIQSEKRSEMMASLLVAKLQKFDTYRKQRQPVDLSKIC